MSKVKVLILLIMLIPLICWTFPAPSTTLIIFDRKTQTSILEIPVDIGDSLKLELEHSFEHIPWYEYYTIMENGSFNLDKIAVAGYGAGIPAEMSVTHTIKDGMVWMEGINSNFTELKWLTSNLYQKGLYLNDELIFDFRSLPNASLIMAYIK